MKSNTASVKKEVEIVPEVESMLDRAQLTEIEKHQNTISKEVAEIKVTSKETYDTACHLGIQNKHRLTQIENLRVAIVKPIKDHLKKIDQFFNGLKKPFEENDSTLRTKLLKYQTSLKKPEAIKNRHIDDGSRATISMVMKFEVTDEKLVPREYLCVDESKIGREVRARAAGVMDKNEKGEITSKIPGVRIWEEPSTSFVPQN